MIDWPKIIENINFSTANDEKYHSHKSVSGGDINQAVQLTTQTKQHYFIKLNDFDLIDMFKAEFEALKELQQCTTIMTPEPICYGQLGKHSYIVMQYLDLHHQGDHYSFGNNLAKMHKISQKKFGWHTNNTIGSTPQSNQQSDSWVEFWKTQRLIPQFNLLYQKGHQGLFKKNADYLLAGLEQFFNGHEPIASLLHGDLWSGNASFDNKGRGVIFDPALYYGDRETDLAMTELFGGFTKDFYKGYQEEFELADNYNTRKKMYNLYHILNHANLFGGSYIQQSVNTIELIIKKL